MFCKHKWKVVSDKVLPSRVESYLTTMKKFASGKIHIPYENLSAAVTSVTILTCENCGEVKKIVTTN